MRRHLVASKHTLPERRSWCAAGSGLVPLVRPVSTMPVFTHGRHWMGMMLVVVLVVMLVLLVMMPSVIVTISGIKLRQELGRRWGNWERLACHKGCPCWRQPRGRIGMSLPLLRGFGLSGLLGQELRHWR